MARLVIFAAILAALANAFAPATVAVRSARVVAVPAAASSAVVEEAEVMINAAIESGMKSMETRVKLLTADIDAAEKVATENAIYSRLDKIEEMISDIARKL
eukprot:CAMPEP_0197414660 /NCGR_PEP_ID=MMETSP1170-20131217/1349_1 /TAXON_ID=54406 /ORGANISM="Sarcinochrysis sp, Strain CCMP770" /LENGTH=101 /DNA_ID=CAMNT_0042941389 /DNA_START=44 /DNA_END=349 /DNA_ORIENTATION=-